MIRQPTYFLAHGNPTWLGLPNASGPTFLKSLGKKLLSSPNRPKAVVIISAHWETQPHVKVTTVDKHSLLYDFYGFPKEYYEIKYPAVGHPEVAERAKRLLEAGGFKVADETKRGLDHGVFTPLLYMFPNQEIPVVAISLPITTDPIKYYQLGKSLSPMRNEGALIIGAGYITHNLGVFREKGMSEQFTKKIDDWARSFVETVEEAVASTKGPQRLQALLATYKHPHYQKAHPTPEHYAPLLVAAGAGEEEEGKLIHSAWEFGCFTEDSFQFGKDV
ncbi:hypothetical protein HDV05_002808 [Chytridiales sp. JEL 0842]|nr:hypothetical protein HDV05_002808 [Chytridiales sp. JEL 0842]